MSYKAVFFDWDGVITDSVDIKTKAFAELYRRYGSDIVRRVTDYHLRHGGVSRFEKIKYFHNNFLGMDISENEITALADKFSELVFNAIVLSDFIPGAKETIKEEYTKGTLLFVASGTPTEEIVKIAEAKNMSQYFKEIIGAPIKKTEIVKQLILKYSLLSEDCLMIGDALEDCRAASDNGINFIGIAAGSGGFKTEFPKGTVVLERVCI